MLIRRIANHLDLDPAEVRRIVHRLRVKGYPVIGDNEGLHKTHTDQLIYEQAEKMIHQASVMQEAAEGLLRKCKGDLDELEEQVYEMLDTKDLPEPEPLKRFEFITEGDLK